MKKIIDIHAHAISFDKDTTGCFISRKLTRTLFFNVMKRLFNIKNDDSLLDMDAKVNSNLKKTLESLVDIDHVVLLAFDGVYSGGKLDMENTHFYVANDYVKELSKKNKKVLYGASVNPCRKDSLDELERVIKNGATLVKWLPNTQGIDPQDKSHTDFYKMMAKNKIPLLVHTGREYGLPVIAQKYGDFRRLALPLNEGVTVIAAHGGGLSVDNFAGDYDALTGFLKDYPNFYVDTSALFLLNKRRSFYRLAKARELHHKIIYGSDWPIPSNPVFFVKNASVIDVMKSLSNKNFIQRNYLLTKKLDFSEEIYYKGYEIIKKDSGFESI